jgi:hypothetical protein
MISSVPPSTRRLGGTIRSMRPWGKRALIAVAVMCAGVGAVRAAAERHSDAPSAVAGALPHSYRLMLTEESAHGTVHVARYGKPGTEPGDAPLAVTSVRNGASDDPQPADRPATVRGHAAVLRTLTDEDKSYAKELVWQERSDLLVEVTADLPASEQRLAEIAEQVRVIDQPGWALLHKQTSYAAIIGRVTPDLERVRVLRGRAGGHRWALSALIPPHFPLSRDDLRASCEELTYSGQRGHGTDCGLAPNWQRVGGRIFVFGAVPRTLRRVRIRAYQGGGLDLMVSARPARRGPRVRYFAAPLPEGSCAVVVSGLHAPLDDGAVAAPLYGADQRRCAG